MDEIGAYPQSAYCPPALSWCDKHKELTVPPRPPLTRVLCVDDDPTMLVLLAICLRGPGRTVVSATGSEDALDQLRGEAPELAVLDVQLGAGDDGFKTRDALRVRFPAADPRVVFLTAEPEAIPASIRFAPDVLAVLAKPYDPQTMGREINRLWQADDQ